MAPPTWNNSKVFTVDDKSSNHNQVVGAIRNNQIAKLSVKTNETTNAFLSAVTNSNNVTTSFNYKRKTIAVTGYIAPEEVLPSRFKTIAVLLGGKQPEELYRHITLPEYRPKFPIQI